jgi:mRNA-degrading endonuclease toxin of MazEF toxin-antitoxin module
VNRGEVWVAEVGCKRRPILVLTRSEVINCDGIHTVAQSALTSYIGSASGATLERVCAAINQALGC